MASRALRAIFETYRAADAGLDHYYSSRGNHPRNNLDRFIHPCTHGRHAPICPQPLDDINLVTQNHVSRFLQPSCTVKLAWVNKVLGTTRPAGVNGSLTFRPLNCHSIMEINLSEFYRLLASLPGTCRCREERWQVITYVACDIARRA